MRRWLTSAFLPAVLLLPLCLGGCVDGVKESRVRKALVAAGLSEDHAQCMAHRMVQKLSLAQLRRLERFGDGASAGGRGRSIDDYVEAVRRVGDADAIEVTVSSAALCATGLI